MLPRASFPISSPSISVNTPNALQDPHLSSSQVGEHIVDVQGVPLERGIKRLCLELPESPPSLAKTAQAALPKATRADLLKRSIDNIGDQSPDRWAYVFAGMLKSSLMFADQQLGQLNDTFRRLTAEEEGIVGLNDTVRKALYECFVDKLVALVNQLDTLSEHERWPVFKALCACVASSPDLIQAGALNVLAQSLSKLPPDHLLEAFKMLFDANANDKLEDSHQVAKEVWGDLAKNVPSFSAYDVRMEAFKLLLQPKGYPVKDEWAELIQSLKMFPENYRMDGFVALFESTEGHDNVDVAYLLSSMANAVDSVPKGSRADFLEHYLTIANTHLTERQCISVINRLERCVNDLPGYDETRIRKAKENALYVIFEMYKDVDDDLND